MKDRMNAARDFPAYTCPASRHAQAISEALIDGTEYPMIADEPEYCGETIATVVAALWEGRAKIAELEAENANLRAALAAMKEDGNEPRAALIERTEE